MNVSFPITLVALLFALVSCRVGEVRETKAVAADSGRDIHWLDASEMRGDPTVSDVWKALKVARDGSLDGFLETMHDRFPGFMRTYTWMYKSGDPQPGSFQAPRTIVFGATARTVLTFDAEASTVEWMTFDALKGYEFREIRFRGENPRLGNHKMIAGDEIDAEHSDLNVEVSTANPAKCADCHGYMSAHPIWDAYFLWPGAFGSEDDQALRVDRAHSLGRVLSLANEAHDPEREAYAKFRKTFSFAPRYRWLGNSNALGGALDLQYGERINAALSARLTEQGDVLLAREILARASPAQIDAVISGRVADNIPEKARALLYRVSFAALERELEILGDAVSLPKKSSGRGEVERLVPGHSDAENAAVYELNRAATPAPYSLVYELGIDLSNYALNRSRLPVWNDAGEPHATLARALKALRDAKKN